MGEFHVHVNVHQMHLTVSQIFKCSFGGPAPAPAAEAGWHKEAGTTEVVARYETGDQDNFTQCGLFFRKVK